MVHPLPFPMGPDVQPVRVELGPALELVLLAAPCGLVGALWRIGDRWADTPIGRA
jgi:hypothetical protein